MANAPTSTPSSPIAQGKPDNPRPGGVQPQREWIWDFGEVRIGWPADEGTEIGVLEYWRCDKGATGANSPLKIWRNSTKYRAEEIERHLGGPAPLYKGNPPSCGFQIAVIPCQFQSLPMLSIHKLDAINAALGLPNHHHHYASVRSGAIGMFLQPDKSWLFVRPRAPDFSSITTMLRYYPQTNIMRGVFYSDIDFQLYKNVISEFEACPHPLLLPLLALELTLETNVNHLERYQTILEQMEGSTGYGLLDEKSPDGKFQDYRTLVKDLSKARSGVHLALATLRSTQTCGEFIRKRIPYVNDRLSPDTRDSLKNVIPVLEERVDYVLSTIEHALQRGGVKERLEGQHSTLFNLITQNDSLLSVSIAQDSREIAAASKRDSSSMKIIAVLTTFFLPGTFVSSFFSMPLFDWDKASVNHVATRHFWVFWALTAPLTLAIMAGVVSWAVWHARYTKRTEKKAREKFNQAIADEAQQLKRAATARTAEFNV